jgi:long-chain fatty acid transport protein
LSIGGGPIATYGALNWDLSVALPGPGGRETELELNDVDDWEPAGRVGILFHPNEQIAVSVLWQSKVDFELKGSIDLPGRGIRTSLSTELPLAQVIEVNAYWQSTDRLALLAIFNWEDWSAADKLSIGVDGLSIGATTGFRDTFKIGIGANFVATKDWLIQTGITFDTAGLKDSDRTTALPIDSQIRAAIGARYQWKPSTTLGFSFVYVNLGTGDVSNPTVSGDYDRNHVFVFGLTLDFNELWWAGRGTI